jgi:DNA invertase Pin-like site-specific DNA recombinase
MAAEKVVAYYRCLPAGQSRSGFSLEAQRKAVNDYLNGRATKLIRELTEAESASMDVRPKLENALRLCELAGATLIIAKLGRLSRNLNFLSALQDSGVRFVAADIPAANESMIQFMIVIAQAERNTISIGTKEALATAKARGIKLGGVRGDPRNLEKARTASSAVRRKASRERAERVRHCISAAQAEGASSLRDIAAALNLQGIVTPRGGRWSATQVRRALIAVSQESVTPQILHPF